MEKTPKFAVPQTGQRFQFYHCQSSGALLDTGEVKLHISTK